MATEDFTTYTEVDPNGKLTVTATKAEGADVDSDEDVYLYFDKGVNAFNPLDIDFELYIASTSLTSGEGGMAIANVIGNRLAFGNTDMAITIERMPGDSYHIQFFRGLVPGIYVCNPDTIYYCTLQRASRADTVYLKIYSDAGRTNLLKTIARAGFGTTTKWQYIYGFVNRNSGIGGRDFDGYVQNLDFSVSVSVGNGTVSIAGALGRKIYLTVGNGAVSIAGALTYGLSRILSVKVITSQYRLIRAITSQYRKIRSITSGG